MFSSSALLPIVSLVIGFALKSLNDWISHSRVLEKELKLKQNDFQKETIFEIQLRSLELTRLVIKANIYYLERMIEGDSFRSETLPNDMDEGIRLCMAHLKLQEVRLRSCDIRRHLNILRDSAYDALTTQSIKTAGQAEDTMADAFNSMNEAIRKTLLELGI